MRDKRPNNDLHQKEISKTEMRPGRQEDIPAGHRKTVRIPGES